MSKKNVFGMFLIVLSLLIVVSTVLAKDGTLTNLSKKPAANAPAAVKAGAEAAKKGAVGELTRDEMLTGLKEDLSDADDELFDSIPGLKAEKVSEGNFTYTYKGAKLEDLSAEDLKSVFVKVKQTNTKLRTERIQQQLETIRRAQQISRPPAPPVPPAVRQVPNVPTTPPSAATTPSAPVVPPSARRQ